MPTSDNDIKLKQLRKEFAKANKAGVFVGIQATAGINKDELISNYAYKNEFGINVPERSFMRSTADEQQKTWQDYTEKNIDLILQGKVSIIQALSRTGLLAVSDIVKKISSNIAPENSKKTIEKKGSSKTLIDTGAMRNSIRYKLDGI